MSCPTSYEVPEPADVIRTSWPASASVSATVMPLAGEDKSEVLAFLGARSMNSVIMSGLVRDNGLVSPLNRGTFYACRDAQGRVEGVALIGHYVLVEARGEAALAAFARLAQNDAAAHVISGEPGPTGRFWDFFTGGRPVPRKPCHCLLFEHRWPVEMFEAVRGLRLATLDDLALVIVAHARVVLEELGVNPLETDPENFRLRCARRIERGRQWVWVEGGRLLFKADVVTDSPDVSYLEGIYVAPQERGKGYGLRCISHLSREFLKRTGAVRLLVNEQNRKAQALYRRAGYRLHSRYDVIYLQQTG